MAFGCFNLGVMYEKRGKESQYYQFSGEFYGKACNLGLQDGCNEYKRLNKHED